MQCLHLTNANSRCHITCHSAFLQIHLTKFCQIPIWFILKALSLQGTELPLIILYGIREILTFPWRIQRVVFIFWNRVFQESQMGFSSRQIHRGTTDFWLACHRLIVPGGRSV